MTNTVRETTLEKRRANIHSIFTRNGLWLWVPPMTVSFALWSRLGPAYQPEAFWQGIPPLLGFAENAFRFITIGLSAFLVFGWSTPREKLGLTAYLLGFMLYLVSYLVLISAPDGAWAMSCIGFTAPAWLPFLWITGIGLMAHDGLVAPVKWLRWSFAVCAAGFLLTHVTHASLAFASAN